MKLSLNWLSDYVDIQGLSPEAVAAAFTDIGLEAEGIHKQCALPSEVVVGEILTAVQHPNADTLRLCTVAVGEAEPLAIVCGAPNARAGIKVVVAKVGATLPGDFKIKKSKIRGELSHGMLCSAQELAIDLAGDQSGIIELPHTATVGGSAATALGLGDTVFELNVTPNRPDCLGVIGLARDLAAKLKKPLRLPLSSGLKREQKSRGGTGVTVKISTDEAAEAGCSRFVALAIGNVTARPSPSWLQKKITAAGMRPINVLVDATNFVMLEYGQPVHAYDTRFIEGNTLEVRAARNGETLTTLDGQIRELAAGDLLICDSKGPLGLAGIMGGQRGEVKADTKDIIIEVAYFSPRRIRRTAKRLGLHSEASHRFERGVDIDNLAAVAWRVADVITQALAETSGKDAPLPEVAGELVDLYPAEIDKRVVALRVSHAKQFLGIAALPRAEVVSLFERLEFTLLDSTDDRLVLEIPYFRPDIEREVDLIEEIARLHGFEKIPAQLPVMTMRTTPEDPFIEFAAQAKTALAGTGLRETVSFPFASQREMAALGFSPEHPLFPSLTVANPLSADHSAMQTTLIPGLLRALAMNRRHGQRGARLFEAGRGYFAAEKLMATTAAMPSLKTLARPTRFLGPRARSDAQRPIERQWIAAALDQPFSEKGWNSSPAATSFFHGKAAVTGLLRAFGLSAGARFAPTVAHEVPHLHPGASAVVLLGNKVAGYVGELHPRAAAAMDLSGGGAPVVFELDLEILCEAKGKTAKTGVGATRFPPVTRDLAFLVAKGKTHADFKDAIGKFKRKQHLADFKLFDIYEGTNIPAEQKSMAYAFSFASPERTLTDQDIDQEVIALVGWLAESLGATQRA